MEFKIDRKKISDEFQSPKYKLLENGIRNIIVNLIERFTKDCFIYI
jgi:hypothetical protein